MIFTYMDWSGHHRRSKVILTVCFVSGFRMTEPVIKETWPFDVPFYVKLNQAVGGGMGGTKGVDNTCYPAIFQIDYVRVYQKN